MKWLTREREDAFETLTADDLEGLNLGDAALWVVTHLQEQILAR